MGKTGETLRQDVKSPREVAAALFEAIAAKDLDRGSFYSLLETRYGIVVASGIQTIEPTVTSEEESAALNVPLHSPAFLFQRTSRSQTGEIVEYHQGMFGTSG